jgi:hypothetical protein
MSMKFKFEFNAVAANSEGFLAFDGTQQLYMDLTGQRAGWQVAAAGCSGLADIFHRSQVRFTTISNPPPLLSLSLSPSLSLSLTHTHTHSPVHDMAVRHDKPMHGDRQAYAGTNLCSVMNGMCIRGSGMFGSSCP